jgi:hypothetical protein
MAKRGRPKKYTPEFIAQLGQKLKKWIKDPKNWWICNFAIENDIWEQRIYEFAQQDEDFSETLKKAEQIQKSRLVQLALAKKVDTTMAIFALKNVAGWRDKHEHEHTGESTIKIKIEEIDISERQKLINQRFSPSISSEN